MTEKTKTHYITGPIMFARVFEGNRQTEGQFTPEGGVYSIDIGVKDAKTVKMIKGWNSNYKEREYKPEYQDEVDTDATYFHFKRKHIVKNKSGELIDEWSGAPNVIDENNDTWDGGLIGNGSVCTIKLSVTPGAYVDDKGIPRTTTFVRLETVRVEEHKVYEKDDDDSDIHDDDNDGADDEIPF